MIVCPVCNHRNPDDAAVCQACGGSLERFVYRACPSCGALNPAGNVFCHRCFEDLVAGGVERASEVENVPVQPFVPSEVSAGDREQAVREAQAPLEGERPATDVELESGAERAGAEGPSVAETVTEEPDLAATIPELLQEPESQPLVHEPMAPQVPPSEPETPPQPSEVALWAAEATLEGWEGLVPVAAAAAQPHAVALPAPPQPTEAEEEDAELFHAVTTDREWLRDTMRVVIPRQVRLLSRWRRALLYLLVLLAAVIPVFTGDRSSLFVRPRDSVTSLADGIQSLPAGSAVLISFDYGPAYAGEMDPLALAVIHHLAARGVRVVAMSTNPSGIGLAEHLCRRIASQTPQYRYGESYAILGYLPGPEAGLRTLRKSLGSAFKVDHVQRRALGELPVMKGLASLEDFDQVIVVADDSRSIQTWIEQVQSQSDLRLHALVTAAIQPVLLPYRGSGQLSTLIAGAHSAAEYEEASGTQGSAMHWADAHAAFCVVLLLIAVATNVTYFRTRRRERRS